MDDYQVSRRYRPGTLVIETTFTTAAGSVRLTDAMPFAEGQRSHDIELNAPHEVLRRAEGVEDEVELVIELAPRPEYGLARPLFRQTRAVAVRSAGPTRSRSARARPWRSRARP